MKFANIGNSQTLKRKIFEIKLKSKLKKCSNAELQITLQACYSEIAKRKKKGQHK